MVLQGVLSYVILRPLMTAVGVVAQLLGVFGDGQLRFDRVYLYTTVVSNGSQVRVLLLRALSAHWEPLCWCLQHDMGVMPCRSCMASINEFFFLALCHVTTDLLPLDLCSPSCQYERHIGKFCAVPALMQPERCSRPAGSHALGCLAWNECC